MPPSRPAFICMAANSITDTHERSCPNSPFDLRLGFVLVKFDGSNKQ